MEKKLIIEEISRIQEMMGIRNNDYKRIILEGTKSLLGLAAEEFAEGGTKATERAAFKTAVEDWGSTFKLRSGENATFDQMVKAGRTLAGDANLDEFSALARLAKETGSTGLTDYANRLLKLNMKTTAAQMANLSAAETKASIKKSIDKINTNVNKILTDLESGAVDLPTTKTKLEALETLVDASKVMTQESKDSVKAALKDNLNTIQGLADELPTVPSATNAIKEFDELIPEIKTKLDLDAETQAAKEETEKLAKQNAEKEAELAQRKQVQSAFDEVRGAAKGDARMGRKGFGGPLGILPSWLGNDAKKSVLNVVDNLEKQFKEGTVTRKQILDKVDTELDRLIEVAKKTKLAKADVENLNWLSRQMKKYPKITTALIILGLLGLGAPAIIYRYARDTKREVESEDAQADKEDCLKDIDGWDKLDDTQKEMFMKQFGCRNRDVTNYPDSYMTTVKYSPAEGTNPAEFVVSVGSPTPVLKHYNASTGLEITTTPTNKTTPTGGKTVAEFETWLTGYASQVGYTYVTGSAKDMGNNSFEGQIKYKDGDPVPVQRTWNGTSWAQ
jgi:hypothetical protein